MSVLVGKKAPSFKATALVNGGEMVENFSLDQYLGKKYVIFYFYPATGSKKFTGLNNIFRFIVRKTYRF